MLVVTHKVYALSTHRKPHDKRITYERSAEYCAIDAHTVCIWVKQETKQCSHSKYHIVVPVASCMRCTYRLICTWRYGGVVIAWCTRWSGFTFSRTWWRKLIRRTRHTIIYKQKDNLQRSKRTNSFHTSLALKTKVIRPVFKNKIWIWLPVLSRSDLQLHSHNQSLLFPTLIKLESCQLLSGGYLV